MAPATRSQDNNTQEDGTRQNTAAQDIPRAGPQIQLNSDLIFAGDSGKLSLETYLSILKAKFDYNGVADWNFQKLIIIQTLQGMPAVWFRKRKDSVENYRQFESEIRARFRKRERKDRTIQRFIQLRQLGSVSEYVRRWEELLDQVADEFEDKLLIQMFKAGVKDHVRRDIERNEHHNCNRD